MPIYDILLCLWSFVHCVLCMHVISGMCHCTTFCEGCIYKFSFSHCSVHTCTSSPLVVFTPTCCALHARKSLLKRKPLIPILQSLSLSISWNFGQTPLSVFQHSWFVDTFIPSFLDFTKSPHLHSWYTLVHNVISSLSRNATVLQDLIVGGCSRSCCECWNRGWGLRLPAGRTGHFELWSWRHLGGNGSGRTLGGGGRPPYERWWRSKGQGLGYRQRSGKPWGSARRSLPD